MEFDFDIDAAIQSAFNDVDRAIGSIGMDKEQKQLLDQVDRMKAEAEDMGIDPELTEPREGMFSKFLNFIDKPKQAVVGTLDSLLFEGDFVDDFREHGIFGPAAEGLKERANVFDILRREGVENPFVRGVAGLAGEIILDPLNLITFGAAGAARAGGATLTKRGAKTFSSLTDDFTENLVRQGVPESMARLQGFKDADDIFSAANLYKTSKETIGRGNLVDKTGALADLAKAKDKIGDLIPEDELASLFRESGISFDLGLPLLGHLTGKAASQIKDPGTFGKAFNTTAKFLNADSIHLGTGKGAAKALLGESGYNVLTASVDATNQSIGKMLNTFKENGIKALDAVEGVPVLGTGVDLVEQSVKTVSDFAKKAFSRAAQIGEKGAREVENMLDFKAAAPMLAVEEVLKIFPDIESGADRALRQETGILIDRLWAKSAARAMMSGAAGKEFSKVEEAVKALANGSFTDEALELANDLGKTEFARVIEEGFRQELELVMKSGKLAPEVADYTTKFLNKMDELQAAETALGIETKFVDYYLPHLYRNYFKRAGGQQKGLSRGFFTKKRKFDSVFEAMTPYAGKDEEVTRALLQNGDLSEFNNYGRGLIAETDVASLMHYRIQQSLKLQAQKKAENFLLLHHGMPADELQALYRQANKDVDAWEKAGRLTAEPEGAAYQALKQSGFSAPKIFTTAERESIERMAKVGREIDTVIDDATRGLVTDDYLNTTGARIFQHPEIMKVWQTNPEALQPLLDALAESSQSVQKSMALGGVKAAMPDVDQTLRMIGEVAEVNGQKLVLPHSMKKAIDENIANKDFIKAWLGESEVGTKFLNFFDAANNFIKKSVTLPFPGYWSQNLLGDAMLRAADGGFAAIEPSAMIDTYNLLNGGEMVTKTGQRITAEMFDRILRENAISYGANEFIDVIDTAGSLDMEKLMKQGPRQLKPAEAIKKLGKERSMEAVADTFAAGTQKLKNTFEDFFRVGHLAHHLKRGSSIQDAVRMSQEALINYRDLSPIERSVFRRFFLFYGWTKGSTKRTINQMFLKPGALSNQLRTARGVSELFSAPDAPPTIDQFEEKTLRSLSALEQVAFPLGASPDGKPLIGRGFGLPLNTLNQQFSIQAPRNFTPGEIIDTFDDSLWRTLRKQFASANPFFKGAAEKISGKNLFFDQPLDAEFLRRLPSFEQLEKIAPFPFNAIPGELMDAPMKALLGAVPDGKGNLIADPGKLWWVMNFMPGLSRAASTLRAFTDERIPAPQAFLRGATGVRIEESDPERTMAYERRRQLQNLFNQKGLNVIKRREKEEQEL